MKQLSLLLYIYMHTTWCVAQNEKIIEHLGKQLADYTIVNQEFSYSKTGFETMYRAFANVLTPDNALFSKELTKLHFDDNIAYDSILQYIKPKVLNSFLNNYFDAKNYNFDSIYLEFTLSSFGQICNCLQEKKYLEAPKEFRNNIYIGCLKTLYSNKEFRQKEQEIANQIGILNVSKVENMKSILLSKECVYYRTLLLNHLLNETKSDGKSDIFITRYFDVLKNLYAQKKDSILTVKFPTYTKSIPAMEKYIRYQQTDSIAIPDQLILLKNNKWAFTRTLYVPAIEKNKMIRSTFYMVLSKLERNPTIEQVFYRENTVAATAETQNNYAIFPNQYKGKLDRW